MNNQLAQNREMLEDVHMQLMSYYELPLFSHKGNSQERRETHRGRDTGQEQMLCLHGVK